MIVDDLELEVLAGCGTLEPYPIYEGVNNLPQDFGLVPSALFHRYPVASGKLRPGPVGFR